MANKIIVTAKGTVSVRLDDVYVTSAKHFVEPYINAEKKERYFGDFKLIDPQSANDTLKEAVSEVNAENDSFYGGSYPIFCEDSYGYFLKASNKVKFYKDLEGTLITTADEIINYVYSIEIHLTKTQKGGIYTRFVRAIATGLRADVTGGGENDDLFEDMGTAKDPFKAIHNDLNLSEDDLPF